MEGKNDVHKFCRACLECASWKGGCRTGHPALQPIPVGGSFHRVAVALLQLSITASGKRYGAVFRDSKADTIAKLCVEHIICSHGIPEELLSDCGANFLSTVIQVVCQLLNINPSGSHPQTDGFVEKVTSTLIQMIAKSCTVSDREWETIFVVCLQSECTLYSTAPWCQRLAVGQPPLTLTASQSTTTLTHH